MSNSTLGPATLGALCLFACAIQGCDEDKEPLSKEEKRSLRELEDSLSNLTDVEPWRRSLIFARMVSVHLDGSDPCLDHVDERLAGGESFDPTELLTACGAACEDSLSDELSGMPPRRWIPTALAACREDWGLEGENAVAASADWLVLRRAAKAFGALYGRAESEGKEALDRALAKVRLPLSPPPRLADHYRLPSVGAEHTVKALPDVYVYVSPDGEMRVGQMPRARLGSALEVGFGEGAPFPGRPVSAEEVRERVYALRGNSPPPREEPAKKAAKKAAPEEPEKGPSPPSAGGRKPLTPGRMGRKAYPAAPPKGSKESGAFGSRRGAGDFSGEAPEEDPERGPRRGGVTGEVIEERHWKHERAEGREPPPVLVIADREAPAAAVIEAASGAGHAYFAVATDGDPAARALAVRLRDGAGGGAARPIDRPRIGDVTVALTDAAGWVFEPFSRTRLKILRDDESELPRESILEEIREVREPLSYGHDERRDLSLRVSSEVTYGEMIAFVRDLMAAGTSELAFFSATRFDD